MEQYNNLPTPPPLKVSIRTLPEDIQRKIYMDHFSVETKYARLLEVLHNNESQTLCVNSLLPLVKEMLTEDNELCMYAYNNAKKDKTEFNDVYDVYKKRHETGKEYRWFVKMECPYEDFTLAWLYFKYH